MRKEKTKTAIYREREMEEEERRRGKLGECGEEEWGDLGGEM